MTQHGDGDMTETQASVQPATWQLATAPLG